MHGVELFLEFLESYGSPQIRFRSYISWFYEDLDTLINIYLLCAPNIDRVMKYPGSRYFTKSSPLSQYLEDEKDRIKMAIRAGR